MVLLTLVLLGLCFGSFVNALVWRLHEQEKGNKKKLSILSGRSMCVHCRHKLAWLDLIPVVSWLSLRGKCRYCGKPISWQYPAVEVLTAALFTLSYVYWPLAFDGRGGTLFISWLVLLVGFVALAVYDLRWMLLPNRVIFPLLGVALATVLLDGISFGGGWNTLWHGLFGLVVLGGFFYLLFQVSGGRWIGGGDVKLGVLLGLVVGGPLNSLLVLFLASVIGSLVSVVFLLKGSLKTGSVVPFGPFLITGAIIVRLFGAELIGWYKDQFLFL